MAVNKITNKQTLNKELVNRANEVSTKGTTIRGNRETTIIPGSNFSDNYSITLKVFPFLILVGKGSNVFKTNSCFKGLLFNIKLIAG